MNKEDKDIIYALYGLVGDWGLCRTVIDHLEPYLKERRGVHVADAVLKMGSGQYYRSKSTANSRIEAVHIKLTDKSVACFQMEQVYRVKGSFVLPNLDKQKKKKEEKIARKWSVYVLLCSDNSLYCGISTNVERRVAEHNKGARGAKYTRSRRPVKLLNQWFVGTNGEAKSAELRFKKLSRQDKLKSLNLTEETLNV